MGGYEEVSRSPEHKSEIDELERAGLIKCYNNYCTVTPKGKDLYKRFQNEKNTIERVLKDYYKIDVKDVDMKYITSRALDNLLKFVGIYGFPEPTGDMDPIVKILFIDNTTKSFTPVILGARYALLLLILYNVTLSCIINKKCKNYYPSGKTIIRTFEDYGIYKQKLLLEHLLDYGLIIKAPYGKNKYELTPLGINVAKHAVLQAYVAFKI